ncbi:transcription factor TFIIIB component b'' [Blastomyces parvus]|uniref:Transcription factor TFIIIB component b n=1 Tax=Blastomyces parvus TaxID=2060905 RepID=A0A2B7XCJ1_9EURO|nr:transcription factor TFIIIB component b'' [Blastomyces parvus]
MVSFSSSVINKSGKKFAPKAPVRRVGATSAGSQSARASTDRQTTSKTPQPPPSSITPEGATPVPAIDPAKSTPQPAEESSRSPPPPPPPTPPQQQQQQQEPPTSSQSHSPPRPLISQHKVKSTAIPIPAPRRRPSIPSAQEPPPPPPAATPVIASTPSAPSSETILPTAASPQLDRRQTPQITQNAPDSPKRQRVEQAVDSRPAKRTKIVDQVTKPASTSRGDHSHPGPSTQVQQPQREVVPATTKRPAKKAAKRSTDRRQSAEQIEDGSSAAAAEKKPRARRKRQPTPEDAESIEIAPTVVKMSDLCRDLRTGKKSKREIELQSMDLTELARKQKEREERIRDGHKAPKAGSAERNMAGDDLDRAEAAALGGPQMRIVNGEIVVDATSLQIDRHANAARNEGDMEEVEENPLTKRINAASFGKRTKVESWDEELTDLFYRGLRMFGTDFMMISKMFPGRSRRQIKLKFSNEERRYPERIKETLMGPREVVDLATYSEMTNTVYDDPRVIEKELDEERKRIEAEHAREKEAKEELLRNPSGVSSSSGVTPAGPSDSNVLPSIEGGVNSGGTKGRKKAAGSHKFGGGTEEILGTIDDIAVSA